MVSEVGSVKSTVKSYRKIQITDRDSQVEIKYRSSDANPRIRWSDTLKKTKKKKKKKQLYR